jgi:putative heme-binding domain-containing protein
VDGVGLWGVGARGESPALGSLRAEALEGHLKGFGPRVKEGAKGLYAAIEAAHAGESARLERVLKDLPGGDVRRGQAVFHSAKAACASCHAIGYLGGRVGPDLTKIGGVRTERDLLESILFPSASFVRSYEPVSVAVDTGQVLTGLLRKDAADEVVLVIGADKEEHIPRERIEELRPATVSVMPAGLETQISPQELADLVAFLKACR